MNPELYRHPGERAAREKLKKIPGFGKFIDMLATNFIAAARRQAEQGSAARAGTGVYPKLHDLWTRVQERFELRDVPLHISNNAASAPREAPVAVRGTDERPAVLLDASLLASLAEEEMEAVLAMQAASVRLGSVTLLAAADVLRDFLAAYGALGAPAVLPAWGLENFRLAALFSADRGAALMAEKGGAAGTGEAAVRRHLARLAGAGETGWGGARDAAALRAQGIEAAARAGNGAQGAGNSLMRRLVLSLNRGNSAALVRLADLSDWFASGAPARILAGEITDPEQMDCGASADPAAAYWGEFACCRDDGGAEEDGKTPGLAGIAADAATQAFGELRGSAEKGLGTLFRAGEAFWAVLTENDKDRK